MLTFTFGLSKSEIAAAYLKHGYKTYIYHVMGNTGLLHFYFLAYVQKILSIFLDQLIEKWHFVTFFSPQVAAYQHFFFLNYHLQSSHCGSVG